MNPSPFSLTREAAAELQAGQDLDALIAEKLMGWTNRYGAWFPANSRTGVFGPPAYSTTMSAAWQVVEALQAADYRVTVHDDTPEEADTKWAVLVRKSGTARFVGADAPAAPLAICRAALLAHLETQA